MFRNGALLHLFGRLMCLHFRSHDCPRAFGNADGSDEGPQIGIWLRGLDASPYAAGLDHAGMLGLPSARPFVGLFASPSQTFKGRGRIERDVDRPRDRHCQSHGQRLRSARRNMRPVEGHPPAPIIPKSLTPMPKIIYARPSQSVKRTVFNIQHNASPSEGRVKT
eukprot:12492101-Alexandrium_andersonii.AAC.1